MKIGSWPLLLLVIEHVIKHPEEYDQSIWRGATKHSCGTTRCIAGWIAYFGGWRDVVGSTPDFEAVEHITGGKQSIEGAAITALKLDPELDELEIEGLAESLFSGSIDFEDVLSAVRDLARADGVIPTPLILEEMSNRGIISDWTTF